MQCSRCGAPVEPAPGHPLACRYCGQTAAPPDAPRPSAASARVYVVDGERYSSPEEMPAQARNDFEDAGALPSRHSTPVPSEPPPYAPTRSGSAFAGVALAVAVLVVAGVVASIVSTRDGGSRRRVPRSHHAIGVRE